MPAEGAHRDRRWGKVRLSERARLPARRRLCYRLNKLWERLLIWLSDGGDQQRIVTGDRLTMAWNIAIPHPGWRLTRLHRSYRRGGPRGGYSQRCLTR